ncbi:uridine kinase [Candidatus Omnitrophota bacterium]
MRSRKRSVRTDRGRPRLIALAGPSACGKTSIAGSLARKLGLKNTSMISQDQYYKNWSNLPVHKREKVNFDHPDSFDLRLLIKHLKQLKKGTEVKAPTYSYKLHKRLKKTVRIAPRPWIIVEGLFILRDRALRDLFDHKIYVTVDIPIALLRRIDRDMKHRGESVMSVCQKYFLFVLPMQKKFVSPQKRTADLVLNGCSSIADCSQKTINFILKKG